jgi:hypothetical protein
VETHLPSPDRPDAYGTPMPAFRPAGFRPLRDSARRISTSGKSHAKCSWAKTKPVFRWNGSPAG